MIGTKNEKHANFSLSFFPLFTLEMIDLKLEFFYITHSWEKDGKIMKKFGRSLSYKKN